VFEGDFWGKSVAEFSHSLGQKRSFAIQRKPRQNRSQIINLPGIPSLPNLISQCLIVQLGFDVFFDERGRMMACSWVYCTGERGQSVQKSRRTIIF